MPEFKANCTLNKVIEGVKVDPKTQKAIGRKVKEVHFNVDPSEEILSPRLVLNGESWKRFEELLDAGNQEMFDCTITVNVKRTKYQSKGIPGVPGGEEAQTDPEGEK